MESLANDLLSLAGLVEKQTKGEEMNLTKLNCIKIELNRCETVQCNTLAKISMQKTNVKGKM